MDYFTHINSPQRRMICGTRTSRSTERVSDRPARRPSGRRGKLATRSRSAVPAEPALQCAALASGKGPATRRWRSGWQARCVDYDGGTQQTYRAWSRRWTADRPRVQALDANGLAENTIVIFTSDNGGERFADTWPFTGMKTELLEGGIRIPAMVTLARSHRAGPQASGGHQHGLDADLPGRGRRRDGAGLSADGMNLLPTLTGDAAVGERKLFWRYKAKVAARRTHRRLQVPQILDNTFLFNVVEDPARARQS